MTITSKLRSFVQFGSQYACEHHLINGWSQPEHGFVWSEGRRSVLHLAKPNKTAPLLLEMTLFPLKAESRPFQVLCLLANGVQIASQVIESEMTVRYFLCRDIVDSGDILELHFLHLFASRPIDVSPASDDERYLAIGLRTAALVPCRECETAVLMPENLLTQDTSLSVKSLLKARVEDQSRYEEIEADFLVSRDLRYFLEAYVCDVGVSSHLRHRFRQLMAETEELGDDAFDPIWQIKSKVVDHILPVYSRRVFDAEAIDDSETTTLFEESDLLFSKMKPGLLPTSAFERLKRPPFALRSTQAGTVYVHPFWFVIHSRDGRRCMHDGNPKGASRAVVDAPRSALDVPAVVLQDLYDCSNLAHFLLDCVPRLFHFCEALPAKAKSVVFIFGGIPNDFHRIVLEVAANVLGLTCEQFYFPAEARSIVTPEIFWFSDQADVLHPGQLMHPATVAILDRLAEAIGIVPDPRRRIYVSRTDAPSRRLANEGALFGELEDHGFEFCRLADHAVIDQIRLMGSAGVVVAPHGMGLTHLAFNRGLPRIMELFHPTRLSQSYALLALARGWPYQAIFGTDLDDNGDYSVDVGHVMGCLAPWL